ncbi:MAG: winged helix-turn-helix transcriptional regulator [Flavobacterium sp.]|nr:winged helix-turn-helix transcriptional regulator [Flavobacterium sp.]
MGVTKTAHYTESQNQLALLFKALAHPARLAIIDYLLAVDRCICGDIVNELPLAQPTISQHLKELKQVGLIQGSIEGKSICYCVNPKMFNLIEKYLSRVNKRSNNECC